MVCALMAVLVGLSAREDYWGDEGFTARRVQASWMQLYNPFAYQPIGDAEPFDTSFVYDFNPPLYFAMIRLLAGPQPLRVGLRMASVLPMAGVLLLLCLWSARRLGLQWTCALVLLFIVLPPVLYFGHEARPYALALFWGMLALSLPRWVRSAGWLWGATTLCILAGCLTHFHFVWLATTWGFIHAVDFFRSAPGSVERRRAGGVIAGVLCAGVIAAGCVLPAHKMLRMGMGSSSRELNAAVIFKTLFMPLALDPIGSGALHVAWGLAVAWVGMVIHGLIRCTERTALWRDLALWLGPAGLPLAAHVLFGQAFFERYALFALPGCLMTLGLCLKAAGRRGGWSRLVAGIFLVALFMHAVWWDVAHLAYPLRLAWRPAIEFMRERLEPGDCYSIQPLWLGHCFAACAGQPLQADYLTLKEPVPAGARRVWVTGYRPLEPALTASLTAQGFELELLETGPGYGLWLARRER